MEKEFLQHPTSINQILFACYRLQRSNSLHLVSAFELFRTLLLVQTFTNQWGAGVNHCKQYLQIYTRTRLTSQANIKQTRLRHILSR